MRFCCSGLTLVALLVATPVTAQTAPAAPPVGGPLVPGVCLISREAIYANALVGKAATARLQQLAQAAQAEVDAERKPVDAELKTFQTDMPKLTADQRAQREQALAAKLQPVQAKAQQRGREIEATRVRALERISNEAQSVIAQVYAQKKCGLLLDRNTVLGGNFGNDLTADVVRGLDAKIQTIAFEREILPPPARQ